MDPSEMEYQLNDDALGEIGTLLKSLTWNTSSSLPSRSPSKTEMEQAKKDMMEQLTQMMKTEMEQAQKDMMEQLTQMRTEMEQSQKDMMEQLTQMKTEMENYQEDMMEQRTQMRTEIKQSKKDMMEQLTQMKTEMEVEAKINSLKDIIERTVEVVRSKLAAAEDSIKVLKEEGSSTRTASKMDAAIKGLSSISKDIEVRFTEVNENIQKVKESGEANLVVSRLNFSMVDGHHGRFRDDLEDIKIEMKNLENRMQSKIQLTVETDKNRSGVTDKIQKQNLTMLELRQRIMPEVPLTPATTEGGDGSENDIPTTISDEEEMEEEVVPQEKEVPFNLSAVAPKYIMAPSAVGREIARDVGSKTKKSSDPPSATTPCTTTPIQNQNSLDRTKTGPLSFSNGGQLTKVPETSTDPSPPKPSTSNCTSRAEKKTRRHHGNDPDRPLICLCGTEFTINKNLLRHIRGYNEGKKHVCEQCGKGFMYQCRLNVHAQRCPRTRDKIKPKPARAVDADGQEHKLVPHLPPISSSEHSPPISSSAHPPPPSRSEQSGSVPEGSNPDRFFCQSGNNYATTQQLALHIRRIPKTFECSKCSRKFHEHSKLKRHLKNVHKMNYPQGKFACLDCGETFDGSRHYNAHRLVAHGK